jgi:hypothetical protein
MVTTDRHGADPRTWTRLDVSAPVEAVSWSRDLAGTSST